MLLLLVDPDAVAVADRLAPLVSHHPALRVTPATSAIAARAYLSGAAFDAVAARDRVEAASLDALSGALGVAVAVHTYTDEDDLGAWLRARLGHADAPPRAVASGDAPGAVDVDAARAALETVRDELARLAHALNNPLAVVAGNAQLGRELAGATGAVPDVEEAFASIDAAATAAVDLVGEIGRLRAHIVRALGTGPA